MKDPEASGSFVPTHRLFIGEQMKRNLLTGGGTIIALFVIFAVTAPASNASFTAQQSGEASFSVAMPTENAAPSSAPSKSEAAEKKSAAVASPKPAQTTESHESPSPAASVTPEVTSTPEPQPTQTPTPTSSDTTETPTPSPTPTN